MAYFLPQASGYLNPIVHVRCGLHPYKERSVTLGESVLSVYVRDSLHSSGRTLFRSFLFSPLRTANGTFLDPLYRGFTEPGSALEWSEWMLELFKPGFNLPALSHLTTQHELSNPLDIWVTLPYPDPCQRSFQLGSESPLDFTQVNDRLKALVWWIDLFRFNWAHCGIQRQLRFKGFRWPMDSLLEADVELVTRLAKEIHHRSSDFIWVANYGTNYVMDWQSLGFDAVIVNPNYYGNNDLSKDWIQNAKVFAHYYRLGLQMNYGKGLIYDDLHIYEYLQAGNREPSLIGNQALVLFHFENTDLYEIAQQNPTLYLNISQCIQQLSSSKD
ncbi:DUF4855 domain-containing protein [Marinicrinis lubricantis]|uniref:DUF4855 domain-containing protein n=1 Tax=Marinicrinis lubricantis TaxID=2086470 RepID=A0ABW1IQS0_9BACL